MDSQTEFVTTMNAAIRDKRGADMLIREGIARHMAATAREQELRAKESNITQALDASGRCDWTVAPKSKELSDRLAQAYGLQPRSLNGFFTARPLLEQRTLTTADAGAALELVSSAVSFAATSPRGANSFLNLCTQAIAQGGDQQVGRFNALPAATILANETAQVSAATLTAGRSLLSPTNIVVYEEASRAWVLQTQHGAPALVDLLYASARNAVQTQIIEGSGSNGEILGLVNDSGVTNTAGTSVDAAKVATTVEAVEKQAGDGALAWVITAPAAKLLRQRAEISGGQALLRDGRMFGYPAYIIGGTTAAHAAFGRWDDLLLYSWAPIEIAVNPFAVFQAGIIGARAWATVAAAPLVNGSFAVLDTIT